MADEYEVKGTCPVCKGTYRMKGDNPVGVLAAHKRTNPNSWRSRLMRCEGGGQPAVAGSVDELLARTTEWRRRVADEAETALATAQAKLNAAVEANARWQAFEAKVRRKMAKATK